MTTSVDFSDDILQAVIILWSEKYGCPVYKVAGKMYIENTGEYAGYFDEVVDEQKSKKP